MATLPRMIKVYEYKSCDTCRKALKFLEARGVEFERVPIVDRPPTRAELGRMLGHLRAQGRTFKNLFNTSGQVYRELKIGDRLKNGMGEDEALDLLAKNGKLIKRPFALGDDFGVVGFDPEAWAKLV